MAFKEQLAAIYFYCCLRPRNYLSTWCGIFLFALCITFISLYNLYKTIVNCQTRHHNEWKILFYNNREFVRKISLWNRLLLTLLPITHSIRLASWLWVGINWSKHYYTVTTGNDWQFSCEEVEWLYFTQSSGQCDQIRRNIATLAKFYKSLAKLWHYWANVHCLKWPNIEK